MDARDLTRLLVTLGHQHLAEHASSEDGLEDVPRALFTAELLVNAAYTLIQESAPGYGLQDTLRALLMQVTAGVTRASKYNGLDYTKGEDMMTIRDIFQGLEVTLTDEDGSWNKELHDNVPIGQYDFEYEVECAPPLREVGHVEELAVELVADWTHEALDEWTREEVAKFILTTVRDQPDVAPAEVVAWAVDQVSLGLGANEAGEY